MILISHRGNVSGKNPSLENNPTYIDSAISSNYDVEIDVWVIDDEIFLGHDFPQFKIEIIWLINRINKLWIHCKNINSIVFFKKSQHNFNFFWHENDTLTITSLNYLWVYPGKQPVELSISVMPELYNDDTSKCIGVCSDHIGKYKNEIHHKQNNLF